MNAYTLDPSNPESAMASAPVAVPAPAYAPATGQYPKLESTAAAATSSAVPAPAYMPPMYQYPRPDPAVMPAPMVAPTYMPPHYQYYRPEAAATATPAPLTAPGYVPAAHPQMPYANPAVSNASVEANEIRDWLPWSIVSIFFGGLILNFLPLIFSIVCRRRKKRNELKGARTMSKLALVFNILNTVLTVLAIIGAVIFLIVRNRMQVSNEFY